MKLGRNAPCHCGSGKKYKKCCLEKDEAEQRAAPQAFDEDDFAGAFEDGFGEALADEDDEDFDDFADEESGDFDDEETAAFADDETDDNASDPDAPPINLDATNRRCEEFEEADYESRIALFTQTLAEPALMDGEMAFFMLDLLYPAIVARHERERYDALVEELRTRLPKVYAENAHFYLENRLTNAVVAGRFERVPALMNELAQLAGDQIETLERVVEQMAYYGQLAVLLEALRISWPDLKRSREILPAAIHERATEAVQFGIFAYLEQNGFPAAGTPELFERLRFYHQVEEAKLNRIIALLSGQAGREWQRDDFIFKPRRRTKRNSDEVSLAIPETVKQNLFELSVEFQGWLRREQNLPLTKGELARSEIVGYLLKRLGGKLEPRRSMLESAFNRPKPKINSPEFYLGQEASALHWLCPDRGTFERHLISLLHFLNTQYYRLAATFELMPQWLRFLESRRLIDAAKQAQTLGELQELRKDVLSVFAKHKTDPGLYAAVENLNLA